MWKTHKRTIVLTLLLSLLPIAAGLLLWDQLPDQVATHFGANGEPNGWSSKAFAVFGLPVIIAGCELLCAVFTFIDPKSDNITPKIMTLVLWLMPALSWIVMGMEYAYALGKKINIMAILCLFIGFMFILLGNYLPKVKQNYTVGVKVAWALNDEENWNHTHRFSCYVFILCGIVIAAAGLLGCLWLLCTAIAAAAVAPVLYSYIYYRKHL